jgi:hypothetical protein
MSTFSRNPGFIGIYSPDRFGGPVHYYFSAAKYSTAGPISVPGPDQARNLSQTIGNSIRKALLINILQIT